MDGKMPQQELDFAAAEGIFRERLSTLGNLAKVMGATAVEANVLRYIFDAGGCHRDVDVPVAPIAGSPWVAASEKSVRRALTLWENEGIIAVDRDQRSGGRQAAHRARLLWSSVLRRLFGEARSVASSPAAHGRETLTAGPRGGSDPHAGQPFFSAGPVVPPAGPVVPPAGPVVPPAGPVVPPGGQSDRLAGAETRSPIRVLACARGLLSSLSSVSVVDVVSKDRKEIPHAEILELADEARRAVYPSGWPKDAKAREIFIAAAVLALAVFSRRWLFAAVMATKSAPSAANHPWRYFTGCLRNGLVEVENLAPFPTRQEAATYFAQLTSAIEPAVTAIIGEHFERLQPPKETPRDMRPREEQQAEAAASYAAESAAKGNLVQRLKAKYTEAAP